MSELNLLSNLIDSKVDPVIWGLRLPNGNCVRRQFCCTDIECELMMPQGFGSPPPLMTCREEG